MHVLSCLLLASLVPATPVAAQSLSPIERRLMAAVVAQSDEARALLEQLVNRNSGTLNLAGVRRVGAVLRASFDSLGFVTRWVDGTTFQRAGHLVAKRPGRGPHVLLIGHLDTVFEPSSPFQRLEWLDDSTARGPGVIDMKGGDVIILQALEALAAVGALDRMSITVVLTGDEERPGEPLSAARQPLLDAAAGVDVALGFEGADGDPHKAAIARRGTTTWTLEVTGTPAHSSRIFRPEVGAGAVFEAARILDAFRTEVAGEQYLTFNPGLVLGGTTVELDTAQARGTAFGKTNVVAEHATVIGDVRSISNEQLEQTKVTMQAVAGRHLAHTTATLTFRDGYPPMAPTEGNARLLRLYDQASRDLGFGPVSASDPALAGAADVSFVAGLVPMAIDGLGLKGHDEHTVHETADMRTLPVQTKRAALLLWRIAESTADR